MAALGERIRELREGRHLKQAALARAIPVAPQTLSNWETGVNRVPADTVPAVAAALGLTICDLYGVEEGHIVVPTGSGKTSVFAGLAEALERNLDKVEIRIYRSGVPDAAAQPAIDQWLNRPAAEFELGQSAESEGFTPSPVDRRARHMLERWSGMSQAQQERLLAIADQIKGEP